jgi:hypothetical protein
MKADEVMNKVTKRMNLCVINLSGFTIVKRFSNIFFFPYTSFFAFPSSIQIVESEFSNAKRLPSVASSPREE